MVEYNMLEAKNNLSKICRMVTNKEEDYVIISSNGKPLVKVVAFEKKKDRKPGILAGKLQIDDKAFDDMDQEIADLFYGAEQ